METDLFRTYLIRFLGITGLLLISAAVFNWYIDPYDFFDRPRIEGINALKPTADTRVRYGKPYRVSQVQPRTLIMGNSRPEMGLNPNYACWPDELKPIYNLSIPGIGLYDIYRIFQHAASVANIETLVLGLDFLFYTPTEKDIDPYHLEGLEESFSHLITLADGSENPQYMLEKAKNTFSALLSLQTLADSFETTLSQGSRYTTTINSDGYNPGNQFQQIIDTEGQEVLFTQKNREVANMLAKKKSLFQGGKQWSQSLEITRRILEFARENKVKVVLFINPRHADFLNLIDISSNWGVLEQWKRIITELLKPYKVELWDFHQFNALTIPAPPQQKGASLDGFWEPGHYRGSMGNAVIESIYPGSCEAGALSQLGALINPENIESHLAGLRAQRDLYFKEHPEHRHGMKRLFEQLSNSDE